MSRTVSVSLSHIHIPNGTFSIRALSRSIEREGLLKPVLLKWEKDAYRIVDGRKRFFAAKAAGLDKLPAVVLEEVNDTKPIQPKKKKRPIRKLVFSDLRGFENTVRHALELVRQSGLAPDFSKSEESAYIKYEILVPRSPAPRKTEQARQEGY